MDESVPQHRDAPASSSRESASEPRGKVVSVKHSICTHLKLRLLLENENNNSSWQKMLVQSCLERKNSMTTADHKVLSEECGSRNNHRYAVVVQDLATQWIKSCPCQTKTSQETEKSLQKFLEPSRKPKVI